MSFFKTIETVDVAKHNLHLQNEQFPTILSVLSVFTLFP